MIGQIVNYRYEVLEKIGDGALFSVYKARDKVLNRLIALKVVSKDIAADREFASAVVEGFQGISGLVHNNIARVYDADCTADECFVATEYVRGINVKERIHRAGPMQVQLALDIIIPVLEALDYAHANKVVHGDLRSQDVIVSADGEVKITDFGLSWALDKAPRVTDHFPMRSIHYQAPEVSEGAAPTVASDIYSVGVILYEMLTDSLPFDGATAVSVALKKAKELPTPPRTINAAVMKSLNDVIMRAIEPQPKDRYQNTSSMLSEIRAIREAITTGHAINPAQAPTIVKAEHDLDEFEEREESSWKKTFLLFSSLFFIVVIVAGLITWMLIPHESGIKVPDLLGKTWEEAQSIAEDAGIELVDDGRENSEIYPAGTISDVSPSAGATVSKNNPRVKVKLSNGSNMVEIPDFSGMTVSEAADTASAKGVALGSEKHAYSSKPKDTVISQDPRPGTKSPQPASVELTYSLGPKSETESTTPSNAPEASSSDGQERQFEVSVMVPSDPNNQEKEVEIVVNDDKGETTAYDEMHSAGDKFTVTVPAEGDNPRIRIYVGGTLVKDYKP